MNHHAGIALPPLSLDVGGSYQRGKHKLRVALVASLLMCDFLSLLAGMIVAGEWRFGTPSAGLASAHMLLLLPLYLLSALAVRASTGEALINLGESLKRGMLALATTAAVLLLVLYATQDSNTVSRLFLATSFCVCSVLMLLLRTFHVRYANRKLEGELYSVLVLQDGSFPAARGAKLPIQVGQAFDPANLTPEDYHRLAGLLSAADRVVVRCESARRDLWAHVLQGMNVHAEILAPEIADTRVLGIGNYLGRPTYVIARGPLSLRDRLIKRAFDVVAASLAILTLAPVLLLVALAIKLESPGPVFFRQQRIGRQNRQFSIYKFRSMRTESCDANGKRSATRDDDRITRVGKVIRSTSIDELPQLLNVLRGDMSIVGPRPHAVHSTANSKLFWEVDERYWHRHACKPGLTGLAQVRGHRGATHKERDLTDRLEADLEYLSKWSFWNDIAIILKTVNVVVHKNAY